LRETNIGWYLLGNGYRAYNPRLMRFHSPDSWSPFGGGGLNAYMYCVGDPINRVDPTGHVPWIEPWLKSAAKNGFNFLFGGADVTGPRKLTRAQASIVDSLAPNGMRPEKTGEGRALANLGGVIAATAPHKRTRGLYPGGDIAPQGIKGWEPPSPGQGTPWVVSRTAQNSRPPQLQTNTANSRAVQPPRSSFDQPRTIYSGPTAQPPRIEHMTLLGGEVPRRPNYWEGRPLRDQPPPPQPRNPRPQPHVMTPQEARNRHDAVVALLRLARQP
jgi:RHS repeat-associated protein